MGESLAGGREALVRAGCPVDAQRWLRFSNFERYYYPAFAMQDGLLVARGLGHVHIFSPLLVLVHSATGIKPGSTTSTSLAPTDRDGPSPEDASDARALLGPTLYAALLRFHHSPSASAGGGSRLVGAAANLANTIARLETIDEDARRASMTRTAIPPEKHSKSASPLALEMDASRCYGMKPCIHTAPVERLRRGCLTAKLWAGKWSIGLNTSRGRSMRQKHYPFGLDFSATPLASQQFVPALDCDYASALVLSPQSAIRGEHTSVAAEEYAMERLSGVRGKLWLMIGTSIDQNVLKFACESFGAERTLFADVSQDAKLHLCNVRALGITLAYAFSNGLVSVREGASTCRVPTRSEMLQRAHSLDEQLGAAGWANGPDFVSLSGVEWDFQHWFFCNATPWISQAERVVQEQVDTVRERWPRVKAVLLRPMFRSTYHEFFQGDPAVYARYNAVLQRLVDSAGSIGPQRAAGAATTSDTAGGAGAVCPPLALLDLPTLMNYSATAGGCAGGFAEGHGTCSSMSGWTVDGLHPPTWVMGTFLGLSLNMLSDFATACHPIGGGAPHRGPAEASQVDAEAMADSAEGDEAFRSAETEEAVVTGEETDATEVEAARGARWR